MNVQLLVPFANRQHGVATLEQATKVGISRSAWYRAIDSEVVEQLHPGVVALPGSSATPARDVHAAILAVGGGAMAAATTAGWWWGAEWSAKDPIHLVTPDRRRGIALPGVVLHRPTDGHTLRPVHRHRLPVTNPPRTVLDAAAVLNPDALAAGLDQLIVKRVVAVRSLRRILAEQGRPGRNGIGNLRLVLDEWALGDKPPDSVLEIAMARLLRGHGLPQPAFHPLVATPGGTFELDFGYLERLVDLEVDGWAAHETRAARERDRARDAHLTALGWRVLRFTWFQVNHRPDWVAEMVRKALAVAGR